MPQAPWSRPRSKPRKETMAAQPDPGLDVAAYLARSKEAVDRMLERLLPAETEEPATIHRAMRYSVFAGGKRVRPILILAAGESVGGARQTLLHLGSAVE